MTSPVQRGYAGMNRLDDCPFVRGTRTFAVLARQGANADVPSQLKKQIGLLPLGDKVRGDGFKNRRDLRPLQTPVVSIFPPCIRAVHPQSDDEASCDFDAALHQSVVCVRRCDGRVVVERIRALDPLADDHEGSFSFEESREPGRLSVLHMGIISNPECLTSPEVVS